MYSQLRSDDGRSLSLKSVVGVPTGVSSLDAILGNGFPLGSLVIIIDDECGQNAQLISKCFLSEGIANGDPVYLACAQDPKRIIKELPPAVPRKEDVPETSGEELKIAWRYQNVQQVVSEPSLLKSSSASHDFDFCSKLQEETIKKSDITIWHKKHPRNRLSVLFQDIFQHISSRKSLMGSEPSCNRKLVRIVLNSLGSPFWSDDNESIVKFLFQLRTVLHNSFSVGLVTMPSKVLEPDLVNKCKQLSDIFISLRSLLFSTDPLSRDYAGIMRFHKISPVNSISIHVPEDVVWGFRVKRKKMIIEKLHLPPESNVTEQREQDDPIPNCQLNY